MLRTASLTLFVFATACTGTLEWWNKEEPEPDHNFSIDEIFQSPANLESPIPPGTPPQTTSDLPATNEVIQVGMGRVLAPAAGWRSASSAPIPVVQDPVFLDEGFPNSLPKLPKKISPDHWTPWTSGHSIAVTEQQIFAVDTENDSLRIINRQTARIEQDIYVGARPEQVVVGPDGTAFVSVRYDKSVVRIGKGANQLTRKTVGIEPHGLALSHDGKNLFVSLAGENSIVVLNANTMEEHQRRRGFDRPRGLTVSRAGFVAVTQRNNHLVTVHLNEEGLLGTSHQTRPLSAEMHGEGFVAPGRSNFARPNRARAVVTVPGDPGRILVAHNQSLTGDNLDPMLALFDLMSNNTDLIDDEDLLDEFQDDADHSGYGGSGINTDTPHMVRPHELGVSDLRVLTWGTDSLMDEDSDVEDFAEEMAPIKDPLTKEPLNFLVAQPTDINHHPNMSLAFVTGMGTDNVLVLNTAKSMTTPTPVAIIDVGHAPKAIGFSPDGSKAYVLNAHHFTVSEITLKPLMNMTPAKFPTLSMGLMDEFMGVIDGTTTYPIRMKHSREVAIGVDNLPVEMQLGRRIYTNARNPKLSHGGQFSCNSCHFEGTQDDLTWLSPDGIRQTPLLAGRLADTAPYNWLGDEQELQNNMNQTIDRLGGLGLNSTELDSLEKFLNHGLIPAPNPYLNDSGLTEEQAKGKALFNDPKVGCATCHNGPAMADGHLYEVGTDTELEIEMTMLMSELLNKELKPNRYNTPSLRDLHLSAPYFHNGSAATLMDVLDQTATTMGHTAHLSLSEKEQLVAYLLTL